VNNARHAGRIMAITGGSNGIGRAMALRLAGEGAKVAVIDTADATETIALARAQGGEVTGYLCDVSDWSQVLTVARSIVADLGNPDILVHCAASQFMRPFSELQVDDFHKVQEVNVNGGFHLVKAFVEPMRAAKWGRIVMVSSSSFFAAPPNLSHYIASKAALIGLVRGLAVELGGDGITVNALAPGLTRTDNAVATLPPAIFDHVVANQAVKRSGEPDDQAAALSFIVSDEAAFMTGQTMLVDGGEGHV